MGRDDGRIMEIALAGDLRGHLIGNCSLCIEACDIARYLTPRPSTDLSKSIRLEGEWDFIVDPSGNLLSEMNIIEWKKI